MTTGTRLPDGRRQASAGASAGDDSRWQAIASLPAEELLALLDGDQLGRPLRVAVVSEVLRRGYPWALALTAEDVRQARQRPPLPRWPLTILAVVALTFAVGWWAMKPRDASPVSGSSAPALEVARRLTALRAQGRDAQAVALAEGCAVAVEAPAACLSQLAALTRAEAERTGASDLERARQYEQLALEADHDVIRERVRGLAKNDFARAASLLHPAVHDVEAQARVVTFLARALELEAGGQFGELAHESAACSLEAGQHGLLCRDFWTRTAQRGWSVADPVPDTSRRRALYFLRMTIDAELQGQHMRAISAAESCSATGEPEAVDCRRISSEANARWWADMRRLFSRQERAEREKVPRLHQGF